jgi:two-component system chemotaxis response regulator CheY
MSKRVLIVDDSASIRQAVRFTLIGAGYEVVEAVDGRDALSKLGPKPFDAIVTDLNMPNLDGIQFIQAIRANPAHRFTPMIMLTTESDDGMKQKGRTAGATGWMVKPFTPDHLVAVIRKVAA